MCLRFLGAQTFLNGEADPYVKLDAIDAFKKEMDAAHVDTYKLVSFATEVDDQPPIEIMGKSPCGSLVLTPTRWLHIITAENRKFGTSIEAKSALWDSLSTYAGSYRLDGNRLIVTVDVSWNESWNGTQVTRNWQLDGNRLCITTARAPYTRDPSKIAVTRVIWEKIE